MGAAFRQLALVEHEDRVGVGNGREAVRDRDRGAVGRHGVERGEDVLLGAGVERAGRLVEQQDRRVLDEGPRDRDALLLAARELEPALAHLGGEALRQALDQRHQGRGARCVGDVGLARPVAAIGDVVADGVVEQHRILGNDAEHRAQRGLGHAPDVLPVDQDAPGEWIVEAEQQASDGGLARARGADDGDLVARRNLEAEAVEDGAVGLVAEHHVVEHHRRLADDQRRGARGVGHLLRLVHQLEHGRHVDQPLADRAVDHAEHVERTEQLGEVGVDEDDVAHGELPARPAPHRIGHGPGHQQVDDQGLGDVEQAERVLALHRGLGIGAGGLGVARLLARFGAEVLHRLVVEQRIDRARHGLAIEPVHLLAQGIAPFGDGAGRPGIEHDGERRRGHQRPAEVHEEDHRHGGQLDHGRGDVEQQEIEHHVDALGPALDGLGHLAGAAGEVEPERELVEPGEDILGERAGRVLAHALEHDVAQVVEGHPAEPAKCIGEHEGERDGIGPADGAGGRAGQAHRVDRALVGVGQGERGGLGREDQQRGPDDPPTQRGIVRRPEVGKEAAERRPPVVAGIGTAVGRAAGRFGRHGALM